MSTHKYIDRVCVIAVVIAVVLSALLMNAEALGISRMESVMGYEMRLFATDRVHTIDIVMDDWDSFIDAAESEEYSMCAIVIDGEACKNVAIRGKGNTSLSNVSSMGSERYSFKIEFDHYDSNKSYYGLDKLSLNNIIQDNTYMKDYLTYRMMNEFGVNAPLCSFVYITVNGEDWGLYLAVEGVEDGFLQRNYGSGHGELYKPDSLSFGGGRGNGMDFKMDDFLGKSNSEDTSDTENAIAAMGNFDLSAISDLLPDGIEIPEDFNISDIINGDFDFSEIISSFDFSAIKDGGFEMPDMGSFGGMGSDDVKLKYSDDSYDSYSNIFDNAKTDISDSDKDRLISSLKSLNSYENLEDVLDTEQVIRYFVVHNFVCNGDSYTGSMIHNYYLYEQDGRLAMIPWDYNLAYGTFQGGNAQSEINSPIDTPVSGDMSDRPMVGWIFSSEEYTSLYHQYFADFLSSVDITGIIDDAAALIAEYVEKDPTKFCTYEEFEKGVSTLKSFCTLRAESVSGQLDGTIPSTTDGQNADSSALVDASAITLSDMGTMNNGGMGKGGDGGMNFGSRDFGGTGRAEKSSETLSANQTVSDSGNMPAMGGMQPPDGFDGEMGGMPDFGDMKPPSDIGDNSDMPALPNGNGQSSNEGEDGNSNIPALPNENGQSSNENEDGNSDMPTPPDGNTQFPSGGNNENRFEKPSDDNGAGRDFGNMQAEENSAKPLILMGASVLVLAAGLLFAFKFRR